MPFVRPALRLLDRLTATLGRARRKAPHLASGSRDEEEAYFYLRKLGFAIVARDYRSPRRRGDIDLIAWEGDCLCFIEVKTRSRRNFTAAEAAVDEEKKATVLALAREYLRHQANSRSKSPQFRFDVVSVYLESNRAPDITRLRDAFAMS